MGLETTGLGLQGPYITMVNNFTPYNLDREIPCAKQVTFTFGEKNRGRFTSEKLLREEGVEIEWMPGGGHSMHRDDASHHFWKLIGRLMLEAGCKSA